MSDDNTLRDAIGIALSAVREDTLASNFYLDATHSAIEALGLSSVPYMDIIEVGRSLGYTPLEITTLLDIFLYDYDGDSMERLVRDARRWLLDCEDEFLVEIAVRQGCFLAIFIWGWKFRFFNRRLLSAIRKARFRFPKIKCLLAEYYMYIDM